MKVNELKKINNRVDELVDQVLSNPNFKTCIKKIKNKSATQRIMTLLSFIDSIAKDTDTKFIRTSAMYILDTYI